MKSRVNLAGRCCPELNCLNLASKAPLKRRPALICLRGQPLHPRSNLCQGTCENTYLTSNTLENHYLVLYRRCLSRHWSGTNLKGKSREANPGEKYLRAAIGSSLGKCYRACIKVGIRGELYFIFTLISSPIFLILVSITSQIHHEATP